MTCPRTQPTGKEQFFSKDEIIVSKTDPAGILTYTNRVFLAIAGYTEEELLGAPHNIIRHPDMPRCVFQLLWDTLQSGREIFAYVKNMTKNGDHYWVLAHVTPTFDAAGDIIGYHSSRRVPLRSAVDKCAELYATLLQLEQDAGGGAAGMEAGMGALTKLLAEVGVGYDEFAFSLASEAPTS